MGVANWQFIFTIYVFTQKIILIILMILKMKHDYSQLLNALGVLARESSESPSPAPPTSTSGSLEVFS